MRTTRLQRPSPSQAYPPPRITRLEFKNPACLTLFVGPRFGKQTTPSLRSVQKYVFTTLGSHEQSTTKPRVRRNQLHLGCIWWKLLRSGRFSASLPRNGSPKWTKYVSLKNHELHVLMICDDDVLFAVLILNNIITTFSTNLYFS